MRSLRSAVVATVIALGVAGCAGESAQNLASDRTPTASSRSAGALTQETFAAAVTDAQHQAKTAHVSGSVTAAGQNVTMDGDISVGESADEYATNLTMSAPALGGALRMILVDQALYLNLGSMTHGKYAKLDLSDTNSPAGQLMSQLLAAADPAKSLVAMTEGVVSFEAVGTSQLDGVNTTQYRVQVDTAKAVSALGLGDAPSSGVGALPKMLSYDIWVGDDHLMRRMSFSVGSTLSMTMDFTRWGEPVHVEAPPPGQVLKRSPFAALQPSS